MRKFLNVVSIVAAVLFCIVVFNLPSSTQVSPPVTRVEITNPISRYGAHDHLRVAGLALKQDWEYKIVRLGGTEKVAPGEWEKSVASKLLSAANEDGGKWELVSVAPADRFLIGFLKRAK